MVVIEPRLPQTNENMRAIENVSGQDLHAGGLQPRLALVQPGPAIEESTIFIGDAQRVLSDLPSDSVQMCVTSPPYWGLRDYGLERDAQIGAEESLDEYLTNLTHVFRQVRRVLNDRGTLWLNLGDSYTSGNRTWRAPDRKNPARTMDYRPPTPDGLKPKDLIGVPWRVAFALQADGWYLRSDIIWHKPNCQPESVRDRPTQSHEYLFLFSKSERYTYHGSEIRERSTLGTAGRNRRTVWNIPTEPFAEAHFATFPPALVEPCVRAGSNTGDVVLDPFFGAGTVGLVCNQLSRAFIGVELNPAYAAMAATRTGLPQQRLVTFA